MFSIIICSAHDARFARAAESFARAFADQQCEIIRIPDARSIAEGYNRAVANSSSEYLIFSHDDVEMLNGDSASACWLILSMRISSALPEQAA